MKNTAPNKTLVVVFSALTALTIFISNSAHACFAPSPEQTSLWQELLKRTDTVVYVQVMAAKPLQASTTDDMGDTSYQLKVLETLKGTSAPELTLAGSSPAKISTERTNSDFQNHNQKEFWENATGRSIVAPDCSIKPVFQVGQKYLLFVEKPYHVKSFERVSSPKDLWYTRVKAEIAKTGEKNRRQ